MGQPVFVPADGWPGPPGGGVTSPARGRRINEPGFPVSSDETEGASPPSSLTAAPSSARLRRRPSKSRTVRNIDLIIGVSIVLVREFVLRCGGGHKRGAWRKWLRPLPLWERETAE